MVENTLNLVAISQITTYFLNPNNHLDDDKKHVSKEEFRSATGKISPEADALLDGIVNSDNGYATLQATRCEGFFNDPQVSLRDLYGVKQNLTTLLAEDINTLRDYLARQLVVDTKKVAGAFITEQLAQNPGLLNGSIPDYHYKVSPSELIAPTTIMSMQYREVEEGNETVVKLDVTPPFVVIPSTYIRLINGTQAERNTFDSIMYHEVEGHGSDYSEGSRYWEVVAAAYEIFTNPETANTVLNDVMEIGPYLMELDRLITRLNLDQNPNVITPDKKRDIDQNLSQRIMTQLRLREVTSGIPTLIKIEPILRQYALDRISATSERTKSYLRNLLITDKWEGPLPF